MYHGYASSRQLMSTSSTNSVCFFTIGYHFVVIRGPTLSRITFQAFFSEKRHILLWPVYPSKASALSLKVFSIPGVFCFFFCSYCESHKSQQRPDWSVQYSRNQFDIYSAVGLRSFNHSATVWSLRFDTNCILEYLSHLCPYLLHG